MYLDKCLNSLKNQSYKNIEVIMIDDGSKDNGKLICEQYKEDIRFKYIYQNNAGVSAARNHGLTLANGEWIMFVDPDDYVEESIIEELLDNVNDDIDIVVCCCMANYNGELIKNEFYESDYLFTSKDNIVDINMLLMDEQYKANNYRFTAIGVPWGKIYRKSMLQKERLQFDEELKRMQDNIFNMYAFGKARSIKYINKPLYIYSCDNITEINMKYDPKSLKYYNKIINLRKKYLIENDLMNIVAIEEAFNNEVYKLLVLMINRYFLHPENPNRSLRKRSKELKSFIIKNQYNYILESIKSQKKISRGKYLKIILLNNNTYLYSILVSVKRKIKI